ncbi:lipopolysaccharide biosynthesis protein [Vibrio cholerae]|uniref:lipopolysaccharide biosynthesis protein n=1 Tax=Vibrio cholerae TaxID=666 RepID=UPI001A9D6769|nr:oligosaccharide flippase family protein [Vibrio cholerae]EIA3113404.1 lipopolysaccharide biosynthesis protein [Vibrio cholerae]MBO1392059.1 hypothetical protein [Vibrio cholerae]
MFKRALIINSILYTLSEVLSKVIPFISLPVIIKYLDLEEYAEYSLFVQLSSIIMIMVGFGTYSAVNVNFFKKWYRHEYYYGLCFVISAIISLIVLLLILSIDNSLWLYASLAFGLMSFISQLKLVDYQVRDRIASFLFLQTGRSFGVFIGIIVILYCGGRLEELYSYVICYSLIYSVFLLLLDKSSILSVLYEGFYNNFKVLKHAISFSFPTMINSISGWVRNGFDRFIILSLYTLNEVGILSFSFQLASVISVLSISINRALNVYLMREYKKCPGFSSRGLCIKFSIVVFVILFICSISLYFLALFFSNSSLFSEYQDSLKILPYFLLSFVIQGVVGICTGYLQFFGKNRNLGYVSLLIGLFYIPVSYISIYFTGYTSGAYVFLAGWFVQSIYCFYLIFNCCNEKND